MIKLLVILTATITVACISSCKKDTAMMNIEAAIDRTAAYKIIITGTWQMPQHTVPTGNHFTTFLGMVHSNTSYIFKNGTQASKGVEDIAEVGDPAALNNEIASHIISGKAWNSFLINLPGITGKDSTIINVRVDKSLVSFESMIAPSPDWFVGLESYNLIQGGNWVNDITVNAYGYDAGTEDGDVFDYTNPASIPQQNIRLLTPAIANVIANGNATIAPFATVRFIKQ